MKRILVMVMLIIAIGLVGCPRSDYDRGRQDQKRQDQDRRDQERRDQERRNDDREQHRY